MRAGELNRQITLQNKTIVNDHGDATEAWQDVATVWAAVITTGGGEFYAAQRLNAETSVLFKIRYRAVDTTMRIKYGDRFFDILSINDVDAKHEELQLSCKEVV